MMVRAMRRAAAVVLASMASLVEQPGLAGARDPIVLRIDTGGYEGTFAITTESGEPLCMRPAPDQALRKGWSRCGAEITIRPEGRYVLQIGSCGPHGMTFGAREGGRITAEWPDHLRPPIFDGAEPPYDIRDNLLTMNTARVRLEARYGIEHGEKARGGGMLAVLPVSHGYQVLTGDWISGSFVVHPNTVRWVGNFCRGDFSEAPHPVLTVSQEGTGPGSQAGLPSGGERP